MLHCGGEAGKPVREIFAQLQEELGLESTLDAPEPAPYGNLLVMSSLVELCIRLERIRRRQGKPPQDRRSLPGIRAGSSGICMCI